MNREQLKNKEKAEECLHIRLTLEEKRFLWYEAEKRGVNLSTYVKQKLFLNESQNLYNTQISNLLYKITDLLLKKVKLYCNNEKFIHECERSANELWHYLK